MAVSNGTDERDGERKTLYYQRSQNIVPKESNYQLTDPEQIKQCVEECKARIELGLHYHNPYPRPIHLPPMGLALPQARAFRHQEKLRKISKPVYLKSHDEIS
ncbi:LYR motif-containing protein 1 isoform X2 [Ahaetulla prasina]|uniref:LYR motif-containing protein 1 isoform X2 n=1 Tax=Ahaetulla prasina TaxID=499056 RepID=UPI002647FDA0|nr:LYR motif-containing protein 1 isoform X2 [Ahaetulla prasina]